MINWKRSEVMKLWRQDRNIGENASLLGWPKDRTSTYAKRWRLVYVRQRRSGSSRKPELGRGVVRELTRALRKLAMGYPRQEHIC